MFVKLNQEQEKQMQMQTQIQIKYYNPILLFYILKKYSSQCDFKNIYLL
jgi:hypothetical protein